MIKNSNFGSQENYYNLFYSKVVGKNSFGILSSLWKYPHILLEKPFKTNLNKKIIEVGAGQGEHINFVKTDYLEYLVTDISSSSLNKIRFHKNSAIKTKIINAELTNFRDNDFDRLISTCLLSHLANPEKAMREWRRIVKNRGNISIYLSTDPSLVLGIFRKLTTRRKAKGLGFEGYDLFIAREHKISVKSLIEMIKYNFKDDYVKIMFRPFYIKSWYLNMLCIVQIELRKQDIS